MSKQVNGLSMLDSQKNLTKNKLLEDYFKFKFSCHFKGKENSFA